MEQSVLALIAKINRKQGPGTVVLGSQITQSVLGRITSGSLSIDTALGGGWVTNHWTEIIGHECLCPGTKILCADLIWRPIETLHVGQEIVGFDEQLSGLGKGRTAHFKRAFVTHLGHKVLPVYEITTQFGKTYASAGHQWVRDRNQRAWARTDQLKVGDKLAAFGAPWGEGTSWEAGWLAGFYDGEGSLRADNSHDAYSVGVNQVVGETADFVRQMLEKQGFEFYELPCQRQQAHWQDQVHFRLRGYQALRLMGEIRPQRLLPRAPRLWEGRSTKKVGSPVFQVQGIRYCGEQEVITIETTSKTLIADGLLSHNSAGKSLITLKTIAANQAIDPHWTAVWFATEDFVAPYAEMLGCDLSRIIVINENTMEEVYKNAQEFIDSRSVDCIVIDSLPALVPAREFDGTYEDFQPGLAAFLTGKFMRKTNPSMKASLVEEERPVTGFLLNQWREKLTTYGDPRTAPGGKAPKFFCFIRVDVKRDKWINNSKEQHIGQSIKISNLKNKTAPPGREGYVDAYFADGQGFTAGQYDVVKDYVSVGRAYDIITQRQAWFYFKDQKWNGEAALVEGFRDPTLQHELRTAVMESLKRGPDESRGADHEGSELLRQEDSEAVPPARAGKGRGPTTVRRRSGQAGKKA